MDRAEASEAAARIASAAGYREPSLQPVDSRSSSVFVGSSVVVKITEDPAVFDREVALASVLPEGLGAPLIDRGELTAADGESVRWILLERMPGHSPGMGLPGADPATVERWATQATTTLRRLHEWRPGASAMGILKAPLNHGGFATREVLHRDIDSAEAADTARAIPAGVFPGLRSIADAGPERAAAIDPVHADCHWGNWLVEGDDVTALLDFEWARMGEPADDWMFLARFSGPHMLTVLEIITEITGTPTDQLRAACEVREASYLVSDLRTALRDTSAAGPHKVDALREDLVPLSVDRIWRG